MLVSGRNKHGRDGVEQLVGWRVQEGFETGWAVYRVAGLCVYGRYDVVKSRDVGALALAQLNLCSVDESMILLLPARYFSFFLYR